MKERIETGDSLRMTALRSVAQRIGDGINARGRVELTVIDRSTGLVVGHAASSNIVTLLGLQKHLLLLPSLQGATDKVDRIRVGSGTTAPTEGETNLVAVLGTKTITGVDTTLIGSNPPQITMTVQFDEGEANGEISEAGLLTIAGTLYNRALMAQGAITAITQANPAVVTDVAHGLVDSTGLRVKIESVAGMTQMNTAGSPAGYMYVDVLSVDTFAVYSDSALTAGINSTGFSAYTSGGTWTRCVKHDGTTVLKTRVTVTLDN